MIGSIACHVVIDMLSPFFYSMFLLFLITDKINTVSINIHIQLCPLSPCSPLSYNGKLT